MDRPGAATVETSVGSLLGRVIGDKYGVTAIIGEGGMGAVYEAEHLQIGRLVAVKVLHPKEAQKSEAISRLEHEARVAGRIGHPNICEVYDMGRLPDGSPYLVMERLHGETLAQRIQRRRTIPPYELVDIILQVLSALVTAHERGIIHRDLKPENIFLSERAGMLPVAKLLDFGISKASGVEDTAMDLTRTGMVMGTPYYMAPEQARGERELDHRLDLWAVGVILYEALTGQRPFVARNYNALLVQILTLWHRPVTELDGTIPPGLSRLVDRALAKPREERFQTAREFQEALRRFKRRTSTPSSRRPPERIRVQRVSEDQSEDATMMFARVSDLTGPVDEQAIRVAGSRQPSEGPASAGSRPVVAEGPSRSMPFHDPTTVSEAELLLQEISVARSTPVPAVALRDPQRLHPADSSLENLHYRADEMEDLPTVPALKSPLLQNPAAFAPPPAVAAPLEDSDATVVDPPTFLEDSITVVRRDGRSRGGDRG